jgi:uncharacterized membrane protein
MPYCSHCGTVAGVSDRFCAKCGGQQPAPAAAPPVQDPFENLSPRTACILCYVPVVGWILAVIVLASRKFRTDQLVRFHAFQGLYLFAVWLFIHWAVRPVFQDLDFPGYRADKLLEAVMFGIWIFMMIKTSRQERYVLPLIGELAQRSAAEN